jgi:hypothetical protein
MEIKFISHKKSKEDNNDKIIFIPKIQKQRSYILTIDGKSKYYKS